MVRHVARGGGNFEHIFAVNRHPEWRYIAYDLLKQILIAGPSSSLNGSFLDTLLKEVAEVDTFFQQRERHACEKQLATFALLNHLAVKRILQKHSKLCSSAVDSQRNAEFWRRLCESVVFMSKAITLSGAKRHQVPGIFDDLEDYLEHGAPLAIATSPQLAPLLHKPDVTREVETTKLRIMTWNACAISFPMNVNPVKFLLGLLFGCWWHDCSDDAPLEIYSGAAQKRYAHQADYIRHSGADLVLLQEVLSTSVLESLMLHLSDEFDCSYVRCSPQIPSLVLWACFLCGIGALQSLFLQLAISAACSRIFRDLIWVHWLLCAGCLSISLAIKWRHSIPAHFLFGNIAGQLVVLRRKSCAAITGARAPSFDSFRSIEINSATKEGPSWLGVFFNIRPRGVLRVSFPICPSHAANRSAPELTLLNTHLPHLSDNTKLLWGLGPYACKFAAKGAVLLAGDFNPLPNKPISQQLEPLVQCGLVSADGLTEQNCTWDQDQCLTRKTASTPRTMQLDFFFLQDQLSAEASSSIAGEDDATAARRSLLHDHEEVKSFLRSAKALEITVLSTAIVDQEKFFSSEVPLSDHYGLRTEIELSG